MSDFTWGDIQFDIRSRCHPCERWENQSIRSTELTRSSRWLTTNSISPARAHSTATTNRYLTFMYISVPISRLQETSTSTELVLNWWSGHIVSLAPHRYPRDTSRRSDRYIKSHALYLSPVVNLVLHVSPYAARNRNRPVVRCLVVNSVEGGTRMLLLSARQKWRVSWDERHNSWQLITETDRVRGRPTKSEVCIRSIMIIISSSLNDVQWHTSSTCRWSLGLRKSGSRTKLSFDISSIVSRTWIRL